MTTVCFLPLGPSACRGTELGWVEGLLVAMGLGVWHGVAPATDTFLPPPAPSVGWSWVPTSGLSSCPQPVLPSLGARCGPRYHRHCYCCRCCRHRRPQESLGEKSHLVTGPWNVCPHWVPSFTFLTWDSSSTWKLRGSWILTPTMTLLCWKSSHSAPLPRTAQLLSSIQGPSCYCQLTSSAPFPSLLSA